MARGRGLLLAGLAAGAYAYFKNPENREKATKAFNDTKVKVNSYMESQNLDKKEHPTSKNEDTPDTTEKRKEKMVAEGGSSASIQYYNEQQQKKKDQETGDVKLSPNDVSSEKAENTASVDPENKINTDNL
ncbi:hypothetical protein A1A1_11206 [Planococcus antarcticus DSM 14505]|uniref:YtxH domain-containing protein n=1 Tax=Planococcus antarcticus DSM 14505 TaxID=1185653 RepID=A0A1C7DBV5_9BACL|nr:hypothetical protein [Planococcus antarcticus]ANU08897.1 hypothetical protein BBH88_00370 [Planococcus antarcticus DSM 14505]EIM06432.1 hypothetical protein A1A1_11206 [Planococcus antarcticus DSM 14505]